MLSLSVQMLPISSVRCLAPLSSRAMTGSPACAGFARTGVHARDLQFPFVTIPTLAQHRLRAPSFLGFELLRRERALPQVFRESRFQALGILRRPPLFPLKPLEHAATK
jgi:hypothetical protein